MNIRAMTSEQIQQAGLEPLVRELGPVVMDVQTLAEKVRQHREKT